MAGGVGTRFWPASRSARPKQFLDILGTGKSLLQMTFDRAAQIVPRKNVLIVSNRKYYDLIKEQIEDIQDEQILLEPSMNNTAPCVLYTALHLFALNHNALFAVIPSDHVVLKENEFAEKMGAAMNFASENEAIVTLGIQPTRPDTGYGYINYESFEAEVKKVITFKEKPDKVNAQQYLDSGEYLWNAGIFVWSSGTVINAYKTLAPNIFKVLSQDISAFGSKKEQEYIDRVYPNTPKISVDFAILEKSNNVYTIPADIGWSDLGTWNSLYDYMGKDENDNVIQGNRVKPVSSSGNIIVTSNPEKVIVVKGIKDYILIDDGDVLLIYPRDDEQEIKKVRNNLEYPGIK